MKRRRKRLLRLAAIVAVLIIVLFYKAVLNGKLLYFTSGFSKNVILNVKEQKAYDYEAMILFADVQKQYTQLFGNDLWNREFDGQSFEDYTKNQIKTKIIRVACMNEMAKKRGVVLNREESANIAKAAKEYLDKVDEKTKKTYNLTDAKLEEMYSKFAIANRLYEDMTSNVKVEVSADEARVIEIQYIVADSKEGIEAAKNRISSGESFFYVARELNPNGDYEHELKRGEMEPGFEEAAFNLATGESSDIVEASSKFYLIKCISDNEKTKTDSNKKLIVEKRKLDEFNKNFEEYEASMYVSFNDKAWSGMNMTAFTAYPGFEEIFNKYFK